MELGDEDCGLIVLAPSTASTTNVADRVYQAMEDMGEVFPSIAKHFKDNKDTFPIVAQPATGEAFTKTMMALVSTLASHGGVNAED